MILKETLDYIIVEDVNGYRTKERKFLCIGGPSNGQRMAWSQCGGDYRRYNRSSRHPRIATTRGFKKSPVTQVWIHHSILI